MQYLVLLQQKSADFFRGIKNSEWHFSSWKRNWFRINFKHDQNNANKPFPTEKALGLGYLVNSLHQNFQKTVPMEC